MKFATRMLRLGMPAWKADALAGDLAEDLARRWRYRIVRESLLLLFAAGYALHGLGGRLARLCQPIDVKLAVRMLRKYPGLTIIAVFSMAIAIACGAAGFAVYSFLFPSLPLHEGDRVVSIENFDTRYRYDNRKVLHDFMVWRTELKTLTDVGAFVSTRRNLITAAGAVEPIALAQMSAAGFRVARVRPLMGRVLEERDERPDAEPVMVVGERVWRRIFGADVSIVGQSARLGNTVHTIVGVMPESFGFPINHNLWIPFSPTPGAYERGKGPSLSVFARLAPGVEIEAAKSELDALGASLSAQFPASNAHLRPRLVPYSAVYADVDDIDQLYILQAAVVLLVIVIAVNVAILVYARTVTRSAEIAVRAALGASRGRIITQLFIETAVLSAVAGGVGLMILKVMFVQFESALNAFMPGGAPFWIQLGLSPQIVFNTAALSLLAAAIAGIAPALKVTGRRVQASLQNGATRGAGVRLGKGWTALVVGQVAITAALLPGTAVMAYSTLKFANADPGYPAGNYLMADMGLDLEQPAGAEYAARFAARQAELRRVLESEPGVTAITSLWTPPGREPNMRIRIDGLTGDDPVLIRFNRIDPFYFAAFDATMIAGRAFTAADSRTGATAVIVNRHFAEQLFSDGSALGRRIRYVPNQGPDKPPLAQDGTTLPHTYEIVGIVSNISSRELKGDASNARVYHPTAPQEIYQTIAIRVPPVQASALAGRIRDVAAAIDPAFRVNRVQPLSEIYEDDKTDERWAATVLGGITLAVLVLASGGIYALMSVTVSRRRREIGIRAALGGAPRRILAAIFGRAMALLSVGALLGIVPALMLLQTDEIMSGPVTSWEIASLYAAVVLFLIGVGAAAAYGPARRGLRIQPTEALRADG